MFKKYFALLKMMCIIVFITFLIMIMCVTDHNIRLIFDWKAMMYKLYNNLVCYLLCIWRFIGRLIFYLIILTCPWALYKKLKSRKVFLDSGIIPTKKNIKLVRIILKERYLNLMSTHALPNIIVVRNQICILLQNKEIEVLYVLHFSNPLSMVSLIKAMGGDLR